MGFKNYFCLLVLFLVLSVNKAFAAVTETVCYFAVAWVDNKGNQKSSDGIVIYHDSKRLFYAEITELGGRIPSPMLNDGTKAFLELEKRIRDFICYTQKTKEVAVYWSNNGAKIFVDFWRKHYSVIVSLDE